ncbi:MAG: zinc ribbon domain-containing protein [Nitrosopumilus sp.]|nr:zinc ribbon domain-containing protein [Nitrosopumilus sp.]
MSSEDVIDDVNALLKLKVGDAYRLEHIKQAYIENKTIWITDKNYLNRLKAKYITKIHSEEETEQSLQKDSENKELIHCWKCGKKISLDANFCLVCGAALYDVGTEPQPSKKPIKTHNQRNPIGLKTPIIIGIPILILIILGAGYSQGVFDGAFEKKVDTAEKVDPKDSSKQVEPTGNNSKCGAGTVFDDDTNSCVLESSVTSDSNNSKCGAGTVFDEISNSCVLE